MVIVKWTWKCVRAIGHWFWAGFEIQGYIMAMGYLPPDETQKLVEEFQLSHSS